jgi:ATP-dependent Clp protease ATP-binding subunit ClpC
MQVSFALYQKRFGVRLEWATLGLGPDTKRRAGRSPAKLRQAIVEDVRKLLEDKRPRELVAYQMARGTRLERVRLELSLRGEGKRRKVAGLYPIIVEPRLAGGDRRLLVAYHPDRQEEWFPVREAEELAAQAAPYFQERWAALDDAHLEALVTNGKDSLRVLAFSMRTPSLLDQLPHRKAGVWDDLDATPRDRSGARATRRTGYQLLPKLGTNLTARAVEGQLPLGMPRAPWRAQLQLLLCGDRRQSVVLVGPSGVGKTTLLHRAVHDLALAEGYEAHRNLDRLSDVWRLSGKRVIAGMSYLGDWEKRAGELVEEARGKRAVLYFEDLAQLGRIGRTRDSETNLADFFRGPLERGELTIVGEATAEQLQRLEDDAPSFAARLVRLHVAEAGRIETLRMLLDEARRLERKHHSTVDPDGYRAILDLGGSLFPTVAFPGKALELLRRTMRENEGSEDDETEIDAYEVTEELSTRTGLPSLILRADDRLDPAQLELSFTGQVVGQPGPVAAACDLILRIKAGLTDPRRPYGVYLFTGPTGTGKTELAKCIAEYLYGSASRLVRLDMSELSSPDAPARLIGDRFQPEGILTQKLLEQPFCVVLFDEIEKAHPSVLNLLLQLFDEGRLTDAAGNTASFVHAVVVMTSNLGARPQAAIGFGDAAAAILADVARAVKDFFPPELFNRIDRVVPFSPLPPEVAETIAAKELARLLSRRGLTDRNVFIQATPGVEKRVAREAFQAADGARSLKRYLEDRIGSLLTDEIARGRPGMRVLRLYEGDGGYRLHAEELREATQADAVFPLEALLDAPFARLKEELAAIVPFLEELQRGPVLARLAEDIRAHVLQHNVGGAPGEEIFHLESLRQELDEFRARVEQLLDAEEDPGHDVLEAERFGTIELQFPDDGARRFRILDRRALGQSSRPMREQILTCLAEARFLRRAAQAVRSPEQHSVVVILSRVGRPAPGARFQKASGSGLLGWLLGAYARARGAVERIALVTRSGAVVEPTLAVLEKSLADPVDQAVIELRGLCVLDFFAHETGCHVWQSLSAPAEVVRVEVRPAVAGKTPVLLARERAEARRRFEDALERGLPQLPENPDAALPLCRSIRFDPPHKKGQLAPLELEDYVVGTSLSLRCRTLADALAPIWLLRLSREEGLPKAVAS